MNPETIGIWAGGILGGVIGVMGGVIGTYFTIKNTKGPRERAFVVKGSIVCWLFVIGFIAGMWLIPQWYSLLLVVPYVIVLVLGIRKWNQTQLRIRQEESGQIL
jgi:Ca2+/Na+ antiporter